MTDDTQTAAALVDELELIEQQPLEHRAASFSRIHDALQAQLHDPRG